MLDQDRVLRLVECQNILQERINEVVRGVAAVRGITDLPVTWVTSHCFSIEAEPRLNQLTCYWHEEGYPEPRRIRLPLDYLWTADYLGLETQFLIDERARMLELAEDYRLDWTERLVESHRQTAHELLASTPIPHPS